MTSSSALKVQTLGVGQIESCCTSLRSFEASPVASTPSSSGTASTSSTTTSPVKTKNTTPKKSSPIRNFFSSPKKKKGTPNSKSGKSPSKPSPSKTYIKKNSSTLTSATVPIDQDEVEEVNKRDEDILSVESSDAVGLDLSDDSRSSSSSSLTCSVKIDPSSDLAYHSQKEKDDCEFILQNRLTEEEVRSMPDKFMVVRHYRAEKGDVAKAVSAIHDTLKWRKDFRVHDIVHAFEMKNEMSKVIHRENETGKVYVRGYDADGRACMYLRPGRENTKFESEYNNLAHLVFQLEKAVACSMKVCSISVCYVTVTLSFIFIRIRPLNISLFPV